MLQGVVPSSDLEAINRIRVDCGLSDISTEAYNDMQIKAILQQQQQQMQQQQMLEQQQSYEAEGEGKDNTEGKQPEEKKEE